MQRKNEIVANKQIHAIILGAGREISRGDGRVSLPRCLLTDLHGSRVLDWIIAAFQHANVHGITFVGGYRIEEIGEKYPNLNYIYNPEWETTGVLESFYHARKEIRDSLLVSYADIVYHSTVCKRLIENANSMITIALDSGWRKRRKNCSPSNHIRKNLVVATGDYVSNIGFLPTTNEVAGEFIGLVYFGQDSIPLISSFINEEFPHIIGKPFEQAQDIRYGYMTDLLRHFVKKGIKIKIVDIGSEWAEIDSPDSLARFVMGTKSETLSRLTPLIKKGRFCKQQVFTVGTWESSRDKVMNAIHKEFTPAPVAVRSSALTEDSWKESYAGIFESVLNVDSSNLESIANAISRVIASYTKIGSEQIKENQIFVQQMVQDVAMSGVVFTKDLNTGAPYYVINYDAVTNKTDTVTKGNCCHLRTILVSRHRYNNVKDAWLKKLLEIIREIEHISGCNTLDIEFSIDVDGHVYILQVRPITVVAEWAGFKESTNSSELEIIRDFLSQRFLPIPYLYGKTTVFADMPDWNPAEMIGINPRPLAISLYNYLIMDNTWRIARARIGYHNPEPASLMVCLSGHPYVDVRCSFNNLLPAGLPGDLAEKLVNHYIERLKANHDMHDKVEFEICFTCLDFDYSNQSKRLLQDGFIKEEIASLKFALFDLTDNIINGRIAPVEELMTDIKMLQVRRNQALKSLYSISGLPMIISQLLDDGIRYGTIPFSILARYAFIGNSLLRSLVDRGVLAGKRQNEFLHSVDSIATHLVKDMNAVINGKLSRETFVKMYGHLRPGTYDITSFRYDESPDLYFNINDLQFKQDFKKGKDERKLEPFRLTTQEKKEIGALIKENRFTFSIERMFEFIKTAISLREYAKFEFTKTVSEILTLLCRFGKEYDISRDVLSYLNIDMLRQLEKNVYPFDMRSLLIREIASGREWYECAHMVQLPHLISSPEDIGIIEIPISRPNYITLKKVIGHPVFVDQRVNLISLKGNIAMIKGADPGFDWIFAHGITGLITMYGGACSHMTIRASEFNIPAAIGCGEILFNRLLKAKVIELNCAEKYVATI